MTDAREIIAKEIRPLDGECADNLIEALTSAGYRILGPGEWDKETDWQPIETAPKDEMILGHGDGMVRLLIWEGQWLQVGATIESGWLAPTHWMPLPAPPAIRALAKEKQGC